MGPSTRSVDIHPNAGLYPCSTVRVWLLTALHAFTQKYRDHSLTFLSVQERAQIRGRPYVLHLFFLNNRAAVPTPILRVPERPMTRFVPPTMHADLPSLHKAPPSPDKCIFRASATRTLNGMQSSSAGTGSGARSLPAA